MGFLDIIIAIIVLYGLWKGFKAGLVRSSVSLVGWFVALVAGTRLANVVGPYFGDYIRSPVLQMGLGFLAVVLVVLVIMQIASSIISKIVKGLKLGLVDQLAGGVLGASKNIVLVLVVLSMTAPLLINTVIWRSSVIVPELLPYAPFAKELTSQVAGKAWSQLDMSPETQSGDINE